MGETILITLATGTFTGTTIRVTLTIGANIITVGRRKEILDKVKIIKDRRVEVFKVGKDRKFNVKKFLERFSKVDIFYNFTLAVTTSSSILNK